MDYNWSATALMGAGTNLAPLLHACRLDQRFSYYVYLPKGFHPGEKPADHLLTVIHGTFRDAQTARDHFIRFADETNSVILAPLFPTGIIDSEDIHNYKFIKYKGIRFDEILIDMIGEVSEVFHLASQKSMLYGFSGGGQFVHRFMYLHPEFLESVAIGSPGRVTYLDEEEDWFAGIRDFEQQFGTSIDFEELKKLKILLFVGADDTEAVTMAEDSSHHPAADKYGSNRLERLQALYENYRNYGLDVTFEIVQNVSHEEEKVTAVAARFFLNAIGGDKHDKETCL